MKKSKLFRRSTLLVAIIALAVALTVGAIAGVAMLSNEQEQTGAVEYGEHCSNIQVSTSGAVSLKFYYKTVGDAKSFVYEVYDQNQTVVKAQTVFLDSLEETQYGYCVAVPLAPSDMMNTVKVYPADASGANRGEPMVYSVKEYATDVLADDKYAEYHDAMIALLNWGAMAQVRFVEEGQQVGALPNEGLFARNTNPTTALSSIAYDEHTVTKDDVFSTPRMFVSLEPGNLAVHIYVDYSGNGTLSATVSKDGGEAVSTDVYKTSKGWRVRLANVPANRFDTPYTFTITDGSSTCTVTTTIREYLGVIVGDTATYDEATRNVAKSMYQLYQIVAEKTGAESCSHCTAGQVYWAVEDENSASIRCSFCHADLGHTDINNGVEVYASAAAIQKTGTITGKGTLTVMEDEDGTEFVRFTNFYPNRDNWGDIGLTSTFAGKMGATGQYIVIKYRVNGSNGLTSVSFFANTNKTGNKKNLVAEGEAAFHDGNDSEWHTVVIDLSQRVKTPSVAFLPESNGTYNLQYLSIRPFVAASTVSTDTAAGTYYYSYFVQARNDDGTLKVDDKGNPVWAHKQDVYGSPLSEEEYAAKGYERVVIHKLQHSLSASFDIAYIAMCDGMDDVKTLIDTDTYEVSLKSAESQHFNTADDACVHYSTSESVSGSTYSYACVHCGGVKYQKTIPESVTRYCSAANLAAAATDKAETNKLTANVQYLMDRVGLTVTNDNAYATFNGRDQVCQWIWNRGPGTNAYKEGNSQDYDIDVGLATHLVFKMRFSKPSDGLGLTFSTTASGTNPGNTFPLSQAEAGEWVTYVVDLKSVFGSSYALDAEKQRYVIDSFYFGIGVFSDANNWDTSYIAFVEGGMSEVAKLLDTDKVLLQTTLSGEGIVIDPNTGYCAGEHNYAVQAADGTCKNICTRCGHDGGAAEHAYETQVVGGVCEKICTRCAHDGGAAEHAANKVMVIDGMYVYACTLCQTPSIEYGVPAEATNVFWPAEALYERATKLNLPETHGASITGKYNVRELIQDASGNYLRLGDAETNHAASQPWGGWFPISSGGGYKLTGAGRYMVIKVRQNNNSFASTMGFWITSAAGHNGNAGSGWAEGSFSITVPKDNQWHVIVIDLAARSNKYLPDPETGDYTLKTIHLRPFGGGASMDNTTDEVMDFGYMAFFNDLDDLKSIIQQDTYELSISSSASLLLDADTHYCANKACTPAYVADETDARGYHYECSKCGKVFAIDFYSSGLGCTWQYSTEYGGTAEKKTDPAGFKYVSFLATKDKGTFFGYIADTNAASNKTPNAIHAGRYLVMKVRGNTTADVLFHIGTDDAPISNGNNTGSSLGKFTVSTMPAEWTVVIVDLAGLDKYSVDTIQKVYLSSTTGGGTTVKKGAQIDIAYVMIVDNVRDITELCNDDENIQFYGKSFDSTPTTVDFKCDGDLHTLEFRAINNGDGSTSNVYRCIECGYTFEQTVSADINYFTIPSNKTNYHIGFAGNMMDNVNEVSYTHYNIGSYTGSYICVTGPSRDANGAAVQGVGSATTESYKPGSYLVFKIRGNVNSISLRVGSTVEASQGITGSKKLNSDQWTVYVVSLADVAKHFTDLEESPLYIRFTTSSTADAGQYVDLAYVAVVDDLDEMRSLLVGDEEFLYLAKSLSNAGTKLNENNMCVNGCSSFTASGTTIVCAHCPTPITSAVLRDQNALGAYTNISIHNNEGVAGSATLALKDTASGYTYCSIKANPDPVGSVIQGRNLIGGNAFDMRYFVLRYRVGENGLGQTNMVFYFNAEKETNSVRIPVSEDNVWHTVVIDLNTYVGNGTVFTGRYTQGYFRPFGDLSLETVRTNLDAHVDFVYSAGFNSLDDVKRFLGTDTYEWFNGSTIEIRSAATDEVVAD